MPAIRRVTGCFCLLLSLAASGGEDPRAWIVRMGSALEDLNYEGTLVQLNGSDAAIMRVVHRVEGGAVTERITAMDEVGREIIREGDETTCILPDQQSVLVERRGDGNSPPGNSPLSQQFARNPEFSDAYYRLAIEEGGRRVGRKTKLVTVRPMDAFRYGYRLWLDNATAMPLKVQISDERNRIVEQILFSDISLPERIPAASVRPSVLTSAYTWHRADDLGPATVVPVDGGAWRAESLPPGFELRAMHTRPSGKSGLPMEHVVYSDGVVNVSVFIDTDVAAAEQTEGVSRMGAANAYTTTIAGRLVTAMGEVPADTVELMARAMRPLAGPPARKR